MWLPGRVVGAAKICGESVLHVRNLSLIGEPLRLW
jgi:hypothetical protein